MPVNPLLVDEGPVRAAQIDQLELVSDVRILGLMIGMQLKILAVLVVLAVMSVTG